jgi:hypothetical protein
MEDDGMRSATSLRRLPVIYCLLVTPVLCLSASGKVIYVDDDAGGANDGTSWENAYVYLRDALAGAEASEKPLEVRVRSR